MSSQLIQDELNNQVRKWGIDVQRVDLSAVKILKEAENGSNAAVGSILKGLGMKTDPDYPTPKEFVRATHGLSEESTESKTTIVNPNNPLANHVSAMGCIPPPEIPEGEYFLLHILRILGVFLDRNYGSVSICIPTLITSSAHLTF